MYKKYFLDFLVSMIAIVVLIPVLLLIFVIVMITMPGGSVLFKQKRIGQHGKHFVMYKIRTMSINTSDNTISVVNDPRITPTGKILRKLKLDELTELFNVILGNMSIVGPRPDVPGYADKLKGNDRRILLLKPGITGPASLKYINEEEILSRVENPKDYNDSIIFPDKIRINLLYLDKWSLALDLKIILHTIIRKEYKEDNYFK